MWDFPLLQYAIRHKEHKLNMHLLRRCIKYVTYMLQLNDNSDYEENFVVNTIY